MELLAEEHALDVQPEREPDLGFKTQWVQDHLNQTTLLDCFAGHLKPQDSICFFYAKQVPFVENAAARRILIGVGGVLSGSGRASTARWRARPWKPSGRTRPPASVGIHVTRFKMAITVVSAVLTAVGGVAYAQYISYVNPDTLAGIGVSLRIVFAVVLGGMYSLLGPTVGTALTIAFRSCSGSSSASS